MSIEWEGEFDLLGFYSDIRAQLAQLGGGQVVAILHPTRETVSTIIRNSPHQYVYVSPQPIGGLKAPNLDYCSNLSEGTKKFGINTVCIAMAKSSLIHSATREVNKVPELSGAPIIYKVRGSETYPIYQQFDQIRNRKMTRDHVFITSDFDDGVFEDIYRYSITKVRLKCQARDAHDLYQCLKNITKVDGDIMEFGSYQGHSGLIMAEYVKRMGLNKQIYLCDTFKGFPLEPLGIDEFWNNTHHGDYSGVDALFEPYDFVNLVKGDFTKTAPKLACDKLCLAMIDCDSYRGTKFAANHVWPKLSKGGIMICEDYGHHVLLGARVAMDEFYEKHSDEMFTFFSFFSGLRIMVKS